MQIFDWNRHSTEWFTQRGETRQCVLFVHRSYVLLHSTFHRRCLAGIFTVHQSSAIIENALKVQMQIFVRTFFDRNRLQKRVHRSYVLSSTFHARMIFLHQRLAIIENALKVQVDMQISYFLLGSIDDRMIFLHSPELSYHRERVETREKSSADR